MRIVAYLGTLTVLCWTPLVYADDSAGEAAVMLAISGMELTAQEAQDLEQDLEQRPDDTAARTRLLGYYYFADDRTPQSLAAHQRHVLWLVVHQPRAPLFYWSFAHLDAVEQADGYGAAKQHWLEHLEGNPDDAQILRNAAGFMLLFDREAAERMLQRGAELEPENPYWPEQLAELYRLSMQRADRRERIALAEKALDQLDRALALQQDRRLRFYALDNIAALALEAGRIDQARAYALELRDMAEQYRGDWNYGNAIHYGHIILGRIALAEDDVEAAKAHLIEAGKTPGSPQLNSFGPDLTLASELLEREKPEAQQAVLEYLTLCANFWEMGQEPIRQWKRQIEAGQIPDFEPMID